MQAEFSPTHEAILLDVALLVGNVVCFEKCDCFMALWAPLRDVNGNGSSAFSSWRLSARRHNAQTRDEQHLYYAHSVILHMVDCALGIVTCGALSHKVVFEQRKRGFDKKLFCTQDDDREKATTPTQKGTAR